MHTPRMRSFSSIAMPRSAESSLVRLVFVSVLAGGFLTSCRSATQPAPSPSSAATATAPAPDPSRFQQDVLLEGVFDEPTELAVAYDGRVFVIERHGTLSVYDPRTHAQRVITKLAVNDEAENGLIGIALDPAFLRNHWIYLNRTVGWNHRLARFTLDGDSLRDERVLLEVKIDRGCCHTGGSLAFNRVGELFVSYGDNSNPFTAGDYAPIDPTPGKFLADALRSSANTQDLRGKILRIRPIQNGTYAIPDGNLFADPKEGRPPVDREMVMVMNGIDIDFDDANDFYAVNGIPFHYQNHPIQIRVGEKVRIYLVNILEFDLINSFHLHANFFDYYDHGTTLEPTSRTIDTVMQCQAQRGILEFSFAGFEPGLYMFHAHQSEFPELGCTAGSDVVGMQLLGELAVRDADTVAAAAKHHVDLCLLGFCHASPPSHTTLMSCAQGSTQV